MRPVARTVRRSLGAVGATYLIVLSLACGAAGDGSTSGDDEPEAPSSLTIRGATFGTSLTAEQRIVQPVTEFQPSDPICISVEIAGRPRAGIVTLRWPVLTQTVNTQIDLSEVNGGVFFSVGQSTLIGGTLSHERFLPPGAYETIVLYNDVEVGRFSYRVAAAPGTLSGPFTVPPIGGMVTPVNPFPSNSRVIFGQWAHPAMPAGEHITFTLLAIDVGAAAPPLSQVARAEMNAPGAGAVSGPFQFSLPNPWPPGSYRVVGSGSSIGQFAMLDFQVR